ncbi:hypothetical protein BN1723_011384 [Verticillium longisporum]|uniref:Uncharacterized protein n=1 Tax=Verticillium longisporum TaxID=100787 RepID=A0A0G4L7H3_VERLO|nr:hypothetical protein BN1723_011384 [Verticillium longisporum]
MASPTSAVKTAALPLDTTIPPTPSSSTPTSANPTEPRVLHNDPARTGFDPQTKWWVNYFNILTGNMTREGQFHYREHRYRVNEERDIRRVEADRDWLFAYSPTIRFMREKIESLNGTLDATNVVCRRCPARLTEDGEVHRQSGGFSPADYDGTLAAGAQAFQPTTKEIPLELLKRRDPILFFDEVMLYESELDDNGISIFSVKVRVHEQRMLLLCRLFMRLDNVLVRIRDTRVYVDFAEDYVLREYTAKEDSWANVKRSLFMSGRLPDDITIALRDANLLSTLLPTVGRKIEEVKLS